VSNPPVADAFLRHVHTWNTRDLSEFDRVIAADYLGHVAAGARDRDGLRSRPAPFRASYPRCSSPSKTTSSPARRSSPS